jgi:hypothetical protein
MDAPPQVHILWLSLDSSNTCNAGIIDQDVDRSELGFDLGDQALRCALG